MSVRGAFVAAGVPVAIAKREASGWFRRYTSYLAVVLKRCARCKEEKSTGDWQKNPRSSDGLHSYCRTCIRAANKASRATHGARYNAARVAKRAADPELQAAHRARALKWYYDNPEKAVVRSKRWRAANPERQRELIIRWRDENREAVRAANREAHYRAPHKARARVATRRARKAKAFVEVVDPLVVWESHGACCGICKQFVEFEGMHVDHRIPLVHGGQHSYANTQPAHALCNMQKGTKL